MAERNPIEEAKALWAKLSPQRRALVIGAAVVTLSAALFVAMRGNTEPYATLYTGLAAEDAGKVLEALKAQNAPYRLENNGSTIEVQASRVPELRIALAQSGLPRGGGIGYELFDKQTFGTSSFIEQMNFRRALQGELERSILSVDGVGRARVHLAIKERTLYKEEEEPSTASVVLTLKVGTHLAEPQVRGIVHLVASSVNGLQPEHVTIVDERGVSLWSGEEGAGSGSGVDLERGVSLRVRQMVERIVGAGHVQVAVTADVDHTRLERTEEVYDKDRTALRSESRITDGSGTGDPSTGGVAGARGNLPGAPAPTTTPAGGTAGAHHLSETRNFEVTRTVSKSTGPKSHVRRLHVAVLVDGVHKDPADLKSPIVARSAEQLAEITSLAREAAGLDSERGDRIEVRSSAFVSDEVEAAIAAGLPMWRDRKVLIAAGVGAGVFVLLIGSLVMMARARRRRRALMMPTRNLPMPASQLAAELEQQAPALPHVSTLPRDRASEAARLDAARAARILTAWVAEQNAPTASLGDAR